METIVVNLFGQPGAGKSTGAAYIFSKLKMSGINAELVTEFAKDKTWEETQEAFRNQAYIFGEQFFRMSRCNGKVDVIITDSPLPLSIIYNPNPCLTENFNLCVMDVFNSFNNMNFFLKRVKEYNPIGRLHTEEESNQIADDIQKLLDDRQITYSVKDGIVDGYDSIYEEIMMMLKLLL